MEENFLEFLKQHNLYDDLAFCYIKEHTTYIHYLEEETQDFIGVYYLYELDKLVNLKRCVPYIIDEKTLLINIHEYVHIFNLYYKLGTNYKLGLDKEVWPLFYERVYIHEHPSRELIEYENFLNQSILEQGIPEYTFALSLQNELLHLYYQGVAVEKLEQHVKKLVKIKNDRR